MKSQKLREKLIEFQKSRDALRLGVLRFLLADVTNREIQLRDEGREFTDEDLVKVIAKQIKRHNDSIEAYTKGGRVDLVEKETSEVEVLREFENYVNSLEG